MPDELDPKILERLTLQRETGMRVKDLQGYRKGGPAPDLSNAYGRSQAVRMAQDDLQADLDATYAALKEGFGWKRKEMEASRDPDGTGFIRTPVFSYSVEVRPEESGGVTWVRTVTGLTDPTLPDDPRFRKAFPEGFESLTFDFAAAPDVADVVDRLEDAELAGVTVKCASDASWCELSLAGFVGGVRIDAKRFVVTGRSDQPGTLLTQFRRFIGFTIPE